jgi:hypothetical protein
MHANKRLLTDVLRKEWNVSAALIESDGGDVIGALQYVIVPQYHTIPRLL